MGAPGMLLSKRVVTGLEKVCLPLEVGFKECGLPMKTRCCSAFALPILGIGQPGLAALSVQCVFWGQRAPFSALRNPAPGQRY